jgi:TatD DNase family protein
MDPGHVFFDAHNHLHDEWLVEHRDAVLADLVAANVRACVVNGTCEADWPEVAELCDRPASPKLALLPSFGLHPWEVGNRSAQWQDQLLRHLERFPHAGLGEIGLDRWMLDHARADDPRLKDRRRAPLDEQIDVLGWQLSLAADRNLAVTIHCLEAFGALHDLLRATPRPTRGFLLHAYSGSAELAKSFANLGAYFSFNSAFLDPRKERVRQMFTTIPRDRLLVESDAPAMSLPIEAQIPLGQSQPARQFLLPSAPSGERVNHPANVAFTYHALAELLGIEVGALARQIEQNVRSFFAFP